MSKKRLAIQSKRVTLKCPYTWDLAWVTAVIGCREEGAHHDITSRQQSVAFEQIPAFEPQSSGVSGTSPFGEWGNICRIKGPAMQSLVVNLQTSPKVLTTQTAMLQTELCLNSGLNFELSVILSQPLKSVPRCLFNRMTSFSICKRSKN